jgi:hypothetical protein
MIATARKTSYVGGIVVDKVADAAADGPLGLHVQLNPVAHGIIKRIREDTGVPNTEAMARILEYFAGLDRKFRLAIINKDPETRRELARLALREMAAMDAAGEEPPGTVEQSCVLIRALATKIEHAESARQREFGAKGKKK